MPPKRSGTKPSPDPQLASPDVVSVRPLGDFRLRVRFDDGIEGDADIAAIVGRFAGVFAPLRDPAYFERVGVDRGLGTISWPNGADIAPETLYAALTKRRDRRPRSTPARHPTGPAPGTGTSVPEICRFFGIVIQMVYRDQHPPHFHARYAGKKASIDIATLSMISGGLPPRVHGFVVEWASLHKRELLADWDRARRGLELRPIDPLE